MSEICIERISENKLSKEIYLFKPIDNVLTYYGYIIYNRNSLREKFVDLKSKPRLMNFREFVKKKKLEDDIFAWNKYEHYTHNKNPIYQITKDGRPKRSGIFAIIKYLPDCPDEVAKEALENYKNSITIKYKVN